MWLHATVPATRFLSAMQPERRGSWQMGLVTHGPISLTRQL